VRVRVRVRVCVCACVRACVCVCVCVCVWAYVRLYTQGKWSGQYNLSQSAKSADMKSRMEELILGPTSARSEMMRRRLNGLSHFTCS